MQVGRNHFVAGSAQGGQIIDRFRSPNGRVAAVVNFEIIGAVTGTATTTITVQRLLPKFTPSLAAKVLLVVHPIRRRCPYAFVPRTKISGLKQTGNGFDCECRSVPRSNFRGACLA